MTFKDHFSTVAAEYASFRPTYPAALFDWIASICPRRELAWDCATGSGQAAVALAGHFDRVVATDASREQIGAAIRHPKVSYFIAGAEDSGLPDRSIDVVTVAQALHWFDLDRFFAEAARVLRPGAPLCVWSYGPMTVGDPAVDRLVQECYHDTVGPYWPETRAVVDSGYAGIDLPGRPIGAPSLELRVSWGRDRLLGYLWTWSATRAYVKAHGTDPIAELGSWIPDTGTFELAWPLTVKASIPSAA